MNVYTSDFETNNSQEAERDRQTHVWLWDLCCYDPEQDEYLHETGVTIEDYFETLRGLKKSSKIYFHNLKFDGSFILNYMLTHDKYKEKVGNSRRRVGEYSTLVTEMGVYYSITVCLRKGVIIEFRDSSKKIAGSVASIASAYDLPILKGSIDYTLDRPLPYEPTKEEIAYIHNDTEIIARVMNILYEKGMNKLTSASDTMQKYKKLIGKNTFESLFPVIPIVDDEFIRNSYRGGVVIADERRSERVIERPVYAYDINSSYPSAMAFEELPYGVPIKYEGKYTHDITHPLYIQRVRVDMRLKENHVPTVLAKSGLHSKNLYVEDTFDRTMELTLTSVDLELMMEHYDIFSIRYVDGYKFKSSTTLFYDFIQPIYHAKQTTKGAEKQLNKIWLNALYGKFATNPVHTAKNPVIDNNQLRFVVGETEIGKPVYTAVASFITSYGRLKLLKAIQMNYANFVYCDTDSVHLLEPAVGIEIDDNKLGAWALEKIYSKSKYLGQKTYMGLKGDKMDVKVAGCPDTVKKNLTFENFEYGNTFTGKLMPVQVQGGCLLVNSTFSLNRREKA